MGVGRLRWTTIATVACPWGLKYQAAIPETTTRHATARARRRCMAPSEEKDPVSLPPFMAAWKSLPQIDGGRSVDHEGLVHGHEQDRPSWPADEHLHVPDDS